MSAPRHVTRARSPIMRYDSPLRYPGGKASLASFLTRTIELNDLHGCPYFEPFAGGAGAALRLLREKVVSEVRINDLDVRIIASGMPFSVSENGSWKPS